MEVFNGLVAGIAMLILLAATSMRFEDSREGFATKRQDPALRGIR